MSPLTCVGAPHAKGIAGRPCGCWPLPMRSKACPGPKRPAWSGGSVRRCAMRCCVSMPRDLRASTISLAGVAPSGGVAASRPPSRLTSCAVPGPSGTASVPFAWWTCASTSSGPMACATASGAFPRCSSGSASPARRPAPRTRRATRPRRRPSKKQLPARLQAIAAEHPGERLQIWCQDEARIGQKGRTTRVWYERGVRPPGLVDQRYKSLYLFAACRPGTGEAFALVLPRADAGTMKVFLEHFSRQLAPDVHAVLVLDQAGWHDERALSLPRNVTLLPLPSASPQLNPVERIWLYLRERYLSHRVLDDYHALLEATCRAWNRLVDETGRLATLTAYPYLVGSEIG